MLNKPNASKTHFIGIIKDECNIECCQVSASIVDSISAVVSALNTETDNGKQKATKLPLEDKQLLLDQEESDEECASADIQPYGVAEAEKKYSFIVRDLAMKLNLPESTDANTIGVPMLKGKHIFFAHFPVFRNKCRKHDFERVRNDASNPFYGLYLQRPRFYGTVFEEMREQ